MKDKDINKEFEGMYLWGLYFEGPESFSTYRWERIYGEG